MNKEALDELVKEELNKMKDTEQKESIFAKAKKTLTSETAKEFYKAAAFGIVQGIVANWTFDTINEFQSNDTTVIEIEE